MCVCVCVCRCVGADPAQLIVEPAEGALAGGSAGHAPVGRGHALDHRLDRIVARPSNQQQVQCRREVDLRVSHCPGQPPPVKDKPGEEGREVAGRADGVEGHRPDQEDSDRTGRAGLLHGAGMGREAHGDLAHAGEVREADESGEHGEAQHDFSDNPPPEAAALGRVGGLSGRLPHPGGAAGRPLHPPYHPRGPGFCVLLAPLKLAQALRRLSVGGWGLTVELLTQADPSHRHVL